MSDDFQAKRHALLSLRHERAEAAAALARAGRQLNAATREQRTRGADPNRDGAQAAALREIEAYRAAVAGVASRERGLVSELEAAFDPRQAVSALSAAAPILLAPLRLETRFKLDAAGGPQLWVRVFPDDCLVDAFDPGLSEAEETAARRFWAEFWAAGGAEAGRREAWRRLVAACGTGRAAWALERVKPSEAAPEKAANEVLLVILADAPLADVERDALVRYWSAAWRASGDAAVLATARARLESDVGAARAQTLIDTMRPANFADPVPGATSETVVVVKVLVLAPLAESERRPAAWSRPAQAKLLPERIMLIARRTKSDPDVALAIGPVLPDPLTCGPDPLAQGADALAPTADGKLDVPDDMAWLVDFERAVQDGLGFRVDLAQFGAERGFARLIALGLRAETDPGQAAGELAELFKRQRYSSTGFAFVPQGAPTNNTEAANAGLERGDAVDAAYDHLFGALRTAPAGDAERVDGAAFAALLGLDRQTFETVIGATGRDQIEARAMNEALWPATLGAFLDEELGDLIADDDIEHVRRFFLDHVSGRGPAPAFRIGRQPYGVALTTCFDRIAWRQSDRKWQGTREARAHAGLRRLLDDLAVTWARLAQDVPHVGATGGDPHQTLLDVIALHPASVEFHGRYAVGDDHVRNVLHMRRARFAEGLRRLAALQQLRGYFGPTARAPITEKSFLNSQINLSGPVVDDIGPGDPEVLSETAGLAVRRADALDYIAWLAREGGASIENLRRQLGYEDAATPRALLYFYLREALLRGYRDASLQLLVKANILDASLIKTARRAQAAPGVSSNEPAAPVGWSAMYLSDARIAGESGLMVADVVARDLSDRDRADPRLRAQIDALDALKGLPTARLERLFAEHVDCCSFRLDAWRIGLVRAELARRGAEAGGERPAGVYFGAYGMLENVTPTPRARTPKPLTPAQQQTFGAAPVETDTSNGGFILAPSVNHAVTAGVLRSGYVSNATAAQREPFAVNLTSARVRAALEILDGVRNGQSLGALLGYSFQRGLHDFYGLAEVDRFIATFRQRFPLVANKLASTAEAGAAIETIEARNVVDGLALAQHLKTAGASYPFGLSFSPPASDAQRTALETQAQNLLALLDAVADLAIAESVHQAAQSNMDRAAGALDAHAKGARPPEPEITHTPRSGRALTLRLALHLDANAAPVPLASGPAPSPRSLAQPALAAWIASHLPAPADVAVMARAWPAAGGPASETVLTLADLGLAPIDLVLSLKAPRIDPGPADAPLRARGGDSDLEDRLVERVAAALTLRPDADIEIAWHAPIPGKVTLFELTPLAAQLRRIAFAARPLAPADILVEGADGAGALASLTIDPGRVTPITAALNALAGALEAEAATLQTLLGGPPEAVVDGIDAAFARATPLLQRASAFGLAQARSQWLRTWLGVQFQALVAKARAASQRWSEASARSGAALAALTTAATEEQRMEILLRAELEIAATPSGESTSASLQSAVNTARAAFETKRAALEALATAPITSLRQLIAAFEAAPPLSRFDRTPPDAAAERAACLIGLADLAAQLRTVATVARARADRALPYLAEGGDGRGPARVGALQEAARALFEDDTALIARFEAPADARADLLSALAHARAATGLLAHARTLHFDPAEEWLAGLARVREKASDLEQARISSDAFGRPQPDLLPMQTPYRAGEAWLGLEFPPNIENDGARLLYTVVPAAGLAFAVDAPLCGLMLDEWQEVIPAKHETLGLAFHFDGPNCEPPHAWLLSVSPKEAGAWSFEDLVDSIHQAFDMAKARAVTPKDIDTTAFAHFLPAIVSPATMFDVSITNPLLLNILDVADEINLAAAHRSDT